MKIIKAIPTNIITGALGVGKTTVIRQLLKTKPANERWAILVNEFGEIGIDKALLTGAVKPTKPQNLSAQCTKTSAAEAAAKADQTLFFREVPGGCMCCASGVPMQIALNQLIKTAKPDRLLIEPTGLGHPKELLQVLNSQNFRHVIKLNATLGLIDARNLQDSRWRSHQTFKDQLEIADVIIATKYDHYTKDDLPQLTAYLSELSLTDTPLETAVNGIIDPDLLKPLSQYNLSLLSALIKSQTSSAVRQTHKTKPLSNEENRSESDSDNQIIYKENTGDGFYSRGWIWPAQYRFEASALLTVLHEIKATRLKGAGQDHFNLNFLA